MGKQGTNKQNVASKKVPAKKKKKKKKKRKLIIFAIEIIVLLLLLLVVFLWLKMSKIEVKEIDEGKIVINELESDDGFTTIALFGLDNRSNGDLEHGNSDVIMVASIDSGTKDVKLCSIYRDTYLDRGDGNYGKANAAFSKGGPEQALSMLNKNLDLGIEKYVTVDFNAVTECIDAVGGVELDITAEELPYVNAYVETTAEVTGKTPKYLSSPGLQLCDGTQATAYARVRYTAGDDFKRAERQRTVINQVFQKVKKSDIVTINKVVNLVFEDISTNLTKTEILGLASSIFSYQLGETAGFPFEKRAETISKSKGSVVIPCDLVSNLKQLHEYLYNDTEYTPSNTVQAINDQIINDTGYHEGDGY